MKLSMIFICTFTQKAVDRNSFLSADFDSMMVERYSLLFKERLGFDVVVELGLVEDSIRDLAYRLGRCVEV